VSIKKWSGLCVALLGVHVIALDATYAQVAPSIERVSIGDNGQQVGPEAPTISNVRVSFDGDRVLFGSLESLVSDDRNGAPDGFVRIRSSQTTERVTLRADGSEIIASPSGVVVSGMSFNGRFVAFSTRDDGVVAGDTNGLSDLFVRDVVTGEIKLVSLTSDGLSPADAGDFRTAKVSDDGNIVAFVSLTADLVPGDNNNRRDVFVRDHSTAKTTLLRAPGTPRWWGGDEPDITPDGRYARWVLHNWGGGLPSMSADGRFIVFFSRATDLGPDVSGDELYIFLYDAVDGSISVASLDRDSKPITDLRGPLQISGDGSTVVFASAANDLVPGDTNGVPDVFAFSLRTERCGGMVVTIAGSGEIIGTDGDDVILASAGSDTIDTGAGDDIICALGGGDIIDAVPVTDVTWYSGAKTTISLTRVPEMTAPLAALE